MTMFVSLRSRSIGSFQIPALLLVLFFSAHAAFGQAQSNAADIQGTVKDAANAAVANATVTARNPNTSVTRTATSNDEGLYRIVNVPPGDYEITVEAPNFKKLVLAKVTVTVGQAAEIDATLQPGDITESVTISDATAEIVETSKTAVATTIDQQRINNLPINERNYINFALTTSTVGRDNGRPIGPAPTTGLNFGGQRGRSNLVQVDGADNTDNSVNASRSTVSQEAVQEFQVVTNSFAPEFGRSAGGVVNVVTKSGTNELHGNMFGFLRHRSFQARNAFAPIEDPPFTRTQYGFTLGGPLDRDRTFFFFAFEQRRRNESGFYQRRRIRLDGFRHVTAARARFSCANVAEHHSGASELHQQPARVRWSSRTTRYRLCVPGFGRWQHRAQRFQSIDRDLRAIYAGHGDRQQVLFNRRADSACDREQRGPTNRFSCLEQLAEDLSGNGSHHVQFVSSRSPDYAATSIQLPLRLQPEHDHRHS